MNFLGIISQYSLPAVFAFSLMVVLAALALRLFPKWKMMDRPKKYGLDRAPIPYYGGVLILIVFVVSVLLFAPLDRGLVGVLIGGGVISVVGLLDDKFGLHPLIRLIAQFLAGVILVYSGIGILSINLPFVGTLDFTGIVFKGVLVLSALFTIFWVMAILNVMNFIDGV
ncbi:MAG: hypothetical protein V1679_01900, partial [Candidatus Peregrinibacteria bacterium]